MSKAALNEKISDIMWKLYLTTSVGQAGFTNFPRAYLQVNVTDKVTK